MKLFILCFGRSEFTETTVRSAAQASTLVNEIILINNGWNEKIVPPPILNTWNKTVSKLKEEGLIKEVLNIAKPEPQAALSSLKVCADYSGPGQHYFITDNDCIAGMQGWDQHLLELLLSNPKLNKIGLDFYRTTNWKEINSHRNDLPFYNTLIKIDCDRISKNDRQDFFEYTNKPSYHPTGDPRISSALTDTTLSIVRSDTQVTQHSNRISYSTTEKSLFHFGYLEPIYIGSHTDFTIEMIHYQRIRPMVLTEFKNDYQRRLDIYIENLRHSDAAYCLEHYISLTDRTVRHQ